LATIVGIFALTPVAFVAVSAATPGIASAVCAGQGNEVRGVLVVNGVERAAERANSGTCNGNNGYNGRFAARLPGWRAWVLIQNGGIVTPHRGGGYNEVSYDYSFSDDNSHSAISLCADNGSRVVCGWDRNWIAADYPGGNVSPTAVIPASLIPAGLNSGF
jgi:hypothetical protein